MNVIIAHNSVILRNILSDILTEAGNSVIEKTASGKRIVELTDDNNIDIVILGENLSEYSEEEVVDKLGRSVPILIVGGKKELLALGAVDIIAKPSMDEVSDLKYIDVFLNIVKKCANSSVVNRVIKSHNTIKHIVIGASTGGPNALRDLLSGLPADFPVPISIVQHLEEGHEESLASWLDRSCKLSVRVAINGDIPKAGDVILGIQGKHLTVKDGVYYLTDEERVNFQKPAIDLQFSSASKYYRGNLLGVLLTGMGVDGAKGCLDIIKNGGETVVQDKGSSTVYGMPKAAAELGAASVILPLSDIAMYLISAVKESSNDIS